MPPSFSGYRLGSGVLTRYLQLALSLQEVGIGDDEGLSLLQDTVSHRSLSSALHKCPSLFVFLKCASRMVEGNFGPTYIDIANGDATHDCGIADDESRAI